MALHLTYEAENGRSVTFANDGSSPYALMGVDGLHGVTGVHHSYKLYEQDGDKLVSSQIDSRSVSLSCEILGDVVVNRINLLETMNPKGWGKLILTRGSFVRMTTCKVEQAPAFAQKNAWRFSTTLYCPNPYWFAESETVQDIATWEGGFTFPAIRANPTPEPGKIGSFVFGRRTMAQIVNVYNAGDADVGMKIVFRANGTVLNPSLVSASDYRFVKVNTSMVAGDQFEVHTAQGEKKVWEIREHGGVKRNGIALLDPYSTFFSLKQGDNLFRFEADEGAAALDVSLYFNPLFLGV